MILSILFIVVNLMMWVIKEKFFLGVIRCIKFFLYLRIRSKLLLLAFKSFNFLIFFQMTRCMRLFYLLFKGCLTYWLVFFPAKDFFRSWVYWVICICIFCLIRRLLFKHTLFLRRNFILSSEFRLRTKCYHLPRIVCRF